MAEGLRRRSNFRFLMHVRNWPGTDGSMDEEVGSAIENGFDKERKVGGSVELQAEATEYDVILEASTKEREM